MPYVRVNGKHTHRHKISELEFATPNMKRVPIAEYLSTHRKETNLHQSDILATAVTSGIFEPANAHHQFNKNLTQIKKVYTTIFDGKRKSRYIASEIPSAVTRGAERISSSIKTLPSQNILNNTPFDVQKHRRQHLQSVSASFNTAVLSQLI